ncbi:hypothetical protein OJAV_G00116910 [Oryzias javanicus]|uniref:LIM zinc-binding domain-containing protein n=1 Tax=Oryzias javanicus TaxID=123683 RepID=A0A3S2PNA1_ORYJA|nr:hypothetical protein OJAV_G00116910 [Oryzias javanicus]
MKWNRLDPELRGFRRSLVFSSGPSTARERSRRGCAAAAMVNSRVEAPTVTVMGGGGATGRSCGGCGGRILDRFLLFSMERYWHTRCLKCSCCHAQLGEFSSTCYSKGGMILCRNDYIRLAV